MDPSFVAEDYIVFLLFLLISFLIGVFFAVQTWRRKSHHDGAAKDSKTDGATNEFLLGNRKLPTLPVAISLLASFTSANTVLGYPGIVYQFGAIYWVFCLHNFLSIPVAAHVFIPIFHRLRLTSVYEYLELRFSGRVRLLASVIFCIQTQFYMAVVLYAPAIALRGVTGIKVWVSILSTGLVCTAYTVLGGLKAVVWTDVFQMVVVYVGIFTMLVTGIVQAGTVQEGEGLRWSHLVGGVQRIWGVAANRSRLNFLELSPSPTEEYTLWSTLVGGTFTALTVYVSNQSMVQRYLATRHVRQAQIALYLNGPLLIVMVTVMSFIGLMSFAHFKDCDPLTNGDMKSSDQLMVAMIPLTLGRLQPGLSGLFVACVFSASISTVSSGVNSLAAICIEDFLRPLLKWRRQPLTDSATVWTSRALAAAFGLLTVGVAFLVDGLGSSVIVLALTVFGVCGGPLLGLFVQGVLCPWVEASGAATGAVTSFATLLFIKIGAIRAQYKPPTLPASILGCAEVPPTNVTDFSTPSSNVTYHTTPYTNATSFATRSTITTYSTAPPHVTSAPHVFALYRVSFFWYALIAVVVSTCVASFVSLGLRLFKRRHKIPSDLLAPCWRGTRFTCSPSRSKDALVPEDVEEMTAL